MVTRGIEKLISDISNGEKRVRTPEELRVRYPDMDLNDLTEFAIPFESEKVEHRKKELPRAINRRRIIEKFPELRDNLDPTKLVRKFKNKYSKDPSAVNAYALMADVDTLNEKSVDLSDHSTLLKSVSNVLGADITNSDSFGQNPDSSEVTVPSIISWFYRNRNYGGLMLFKGLFGDTRYVFEDEYSLGQRGFNNNISSVSTRRNGGMQGQIIMFEKRNFSGKFMSFPSQFGSSRTDYPSINDYLNEQVSGIMITRHDNVDPNNLLNRDRFSVMGRPDTITPGTFNGGFNIGQTLDDVFGMLDIGRGRVDRLGNHMLTWDIFPIGETDSFPGLLNITRPYEPFKEYVLLSVPFKITLDWHPDYTAQFNFWSRPFLDEDGKLRQKVEHAGFSMRARSSLPDPLRPFVYYELLRNLIDIKPVVDEKFSAAFESGTEGFAFRDFYLLPGRFNVPAPGYQNIGSTYDDVTIGLVGPRFIPSVSANPSLFDR